MTSSVPTVAAAADLARHLALAAIEQPDTYDQVAVAQLRRSRRPSLTRAQLGAAAGIALDHGRRMLVSMHGAASCGATGAAAERDPGGGTGA